MSPNERNVNLRYNTDTTARKVFTELLSDFRSVHENFRMDLKLDGYAAFKSHVNSIRTEFDYSAAHLRRFKAHAQIACLLKKYRFEDDVYTDDQIDNRTLEGFLQNQQRLDGICMTGLVQTRVLSTARTIARSILGEFQEDDMVKHLRFGAKASIGCPLRLSHIDYKLSDVRAFSGSSWMMEWFKDRVLVQDPILKGMLDRILPKGEPHLVSSLTLQLVPKTYDKRRPITPLPLIDLYYSNGIGGLIQERLASEELPKGQKPIDIRRQQDRHRRLIQNYSRYRTHATADLSAASDSITSPLLNRILPRSWYRALKPLFYRTMEIGGVGVHVHSVLPMGNGATFPVETLVFYVLLRALAKLTGIRGKLSVYGDDLIYPSRLHKYVAWVFPKLGFTLNLDKTYATSNFRESCGADFYHGADVRPFFLKGEHSLLTRSQYSVFLYKVYNGLRRRWDECELPRTFFWLLKELANVAGTIHRVPPSFPDTAGLHTAGPREYPLGLKLLDWAPVRSEFCGGVKYDFSYMSQTSERRFVKHVEPYYWLKLSCPDEEDSVEIRHWTFSPDQLDFIEVHGEISNRVPQLTWKKLWESAFVYLRGKRRRCKIPVYKATSAEKILVKNKVKRAQLVNWV